MTHPTLGYANLRFAGDDAVHMPATPAATMTTACLACGPNEEPFPHDVDAQVTCPNCLHALEADWWMALLENERRTGDVTSLTGTLDDARDAMERLLSQADAVTGETLLGGGASMIEQAYKGDQPAEMTGLSGYLSLDLKAQRRRWQQTAALGWAVLNPPTFPCNCEEYPARGAHSVRCSWWGPMPPIEVTATQDYLFAQDKVSFRARQGDAEACEHVQNPITPAKLDDVMESLAQQLADQRSPMVPRHEPKVARPGPFSGDVPLADPGAERVRRMMEAASEGDPPCSCPGCHDGKTGCFGFTPGCTCDVDWDVVYGHEESSADDWTPQQPVPLTDSVHAAIDTGAGWNTERVRRMLDAGVQKMNALPKGSTLSEQVRAAADAADEFLTEHPFDERCPRCNYDTHRCPGCGEPLPHGTEVCADCNVRLAYEAVSETRPPHDCDADSCSGQTSDPPCGGCCRCLSGCVYDGPDEVEFTHGGEVVDRSEYDYPDRNWCHVHNREARAGREQCSECDGEQGEDRKAGES